MKVYVMSCLFLAVSMNALTGSLEKFNIQVKSEGMTLKVTAHGEGLPNIREAVDEVLISIIGTTRYRTEQYYPRHAYILPAIGWVVNDGEYRVPEKVVKYFSSYPWFFNAELVKDLGLSPTEWISLIEEKLDAL